MRCILQDFRCCLITLASIEPLNELHQCHLMHSYSQSKKLAVHLHQSHPFSITLLRSTSFSSCMKFDEIPEFTLCTNVLRVMCIVCTYAARMHACVRAHEGLSVLPYSLIVLASIIAPIFYSNTFLIPK